MMFGTRIFIRMGQVAALLAMLVAGACTPTTASPDGPAVAEAEAAAGSDFESFDPAAFAEGRE